MQHAEEVAVKVGDKQVILGVLTIGVIKGFRSYVAEREGDPFDGLEKVIDKLPPAAALELVKEAREVNSQLKAFTVKSPLAKKHLATEDGAIELVRLLMLKRQPNATAEDAWEVFVALGPEGFEAAMKKVTGTVPVGNAGAPPAS